MGSSWSVPAVGALPSTGLSGIGSGMFGWCGGDDDDGGDVSFTERDMPAVFGGGPAGGENIVSAKGSAPGADGLDGLSSEENISSQSLSLNVVVGAGGPDGAGGCKSLKLAEKLWNSVVPFMSLVEVGNSAVEKCEVVAAWTGTVAMVDFEGAGESKVGSNSGA